MPSVDANAWTTLVLVKEHLHISSSDFDSQLNSIINRSYKILQKYIGRVLNATSYTEYYDGDGTNELLVDQWPINSITSIHDDISREFASTSLINSADYVYEANQGRIRLLQDADFPVAQLPHFSRGAQNIKIIYNAGYTTIPDDVELASTIHCAYIFNKSGSEGHSQLSLGGVSKSYERTPIPEETRAYLEPYRRRPV